MLEFGKGEYLPVNAYKNKFYIATREDNIYVLEGKAVITDEKKDGTNYSAKVKTFDANYTIFELPYIYYPGYDVRADGIKLDTFETKNGFLGFVMGEKDDCLIEVKYTGSNLMRKSMLISVFSLITYIVINIVDIRKTNSKKIFKIEKIEDSNVEENNE